MRKLHKKNIRNVVNITVITANRKRRTFEKGVWLNHVEGPRHACADGLFFFLLLLLAGRNAGPKVFPDQRPCVAHARVGAVPACRFAFFRLFFLYLHTTDE